ncbi:unnamed protein product, partial [Mesorhabditis belari]|uniref:Uncharacterized protein n=1 Tax=Mesorhabditis belari TaxID=2138241 RepID=A0AAF3FNX7_9BILA
MNSSMLLIDFPSESEADEDGGGGECEDGTCFCHSKSPSREAVSRSNRRQMVEISLDSPHPNILPPFNIL